MAAESLIIAEQKQLGYSQPLTFALTTTERPVKDTGHESAIRGLL
jgi:hypothetical protein